MLPAILLNLFVTNNQIHSDDTRNANFYRPHSCRINIKRYTILYQGPKIWNSLPSTMKSTNSLSTIQKTSRRPLSDFKTRAEREKGRAASLLMCL